MPEFAFPDLDLLEKKRSKFLTETYAFVQTDMSAARTVGYCRRFKYKDTVASRCKLWDKDEIKVGIVRGLLGNIVSLG